MSACDRGDAPSRHLLIDKPSMLRQRPASAFKIHNEVSDYAWKETPFRNRTVEISRAGPFRNA
jgi:hypothetical protein